MLDIYMTVFVGLIVALMVFFVMNRMAWRRERRRQYVLEEDSKLIQNAVSELQRVGEKPEVIVWYTRVLRQFLDFGHSEWPLTDTLPVFEKLLRIKPITPLTDDPNEWEYLNEDIWGEAGGVYQNKRDGNAYSHDEGKSYYLIDEVTDEAGYYPLHLSERA